MKSPTTFFGALGAGALAVSGMATLIDKDNSLPDGFWAGVKITAAVGVFGAAFFGANNADLEKLKRHVQQGTKPPDDLTAEKPEDTNPK
jgi:hypothetical protein